MAKGRNRLDFGDDPIPGPDPGYLNPNQDHDPEIFYCPGLSLCRVNF